MAALTRWSTFAGESGQIKIGTVVAPDADGRSCSVKYHVLPALLLAQNQGSSAPSRRSSEAIATLTARVARLEAERRSTGE